MRVCRENPGLRKARVPSIPAIGRNGKTAWIEEPTKWHAIIKVEEAVGW
jgi:hypothetical protein